MGINIYIYVYYNSGLQQTKCSVIWKVLNICD